MTDTISNEELIARYADLCAAADRHADEGWRSVHEDGLKRALTITADQLDRFASHAIGGIGFEPTLDYQGFMPVQSGPVTAVPAFDRAQTDDYLSGLRGLLSRTYQRLEQEPSITPEEWRRVVRVDGVVGGGSVGASLYGETVPVSQHSVRVSLRAFRMRRMLGHIPRGIVEIGGGHGRFVRDVLVLAPGVRVVYCDLVFNLLLAARYLTRMFGDDVHLAWDDDQPIPVDAKIVLLPPWRLREVPFPVEACCNFLSFHHMEDRNVRFYADALADLDTAVIYHQNRLQPLRAAEATLDSGAFGPDWHRVVRIPLSSAHKYNAGGVMGTITIHEELLAHTHHIDRYKAAYRERLAYEKLLGESLDRQRKEPKQQ